MIGVFAWIVNIPVLVVYNTASVSRSSAACCDGSVQKLLREKGGWNRKRILTQGFECDRSRRKLTTSMCKIMRNYRALLPSVSEQ